MDPQRKLWNERQKELRAALAQLGDLAKAIDLFLCQHAMVHASEMSQSGLPSFEDGLWAGLSEPDIRLIPAREEHSLVWIIWHLARIEDVTMNLLVAGSPEVFQQGGWREKLNVPIIHTGNLMGSSDVENLSAAVDIDQLRRYRLVVGRRTREIAGSLQPDEIRRKTSPARLEQIMKQGAVLDTAQDLLAYWGGLTVAGLLLMPPTRHNFIHLNEAWRIRPS